MAFLIYLFLGLGVCGGERGVLPMAYVYAKNGVHLKMRGTFLNKVGWALNLHDQSKNLLKLDVYQI